MSFRTYYRTISVLLKKRKYDTQYSEKCGKYRIIRIKETVERFIECRDYSKGITRIKCTNPYCDH